MLYVIKVLNCERFNRIRTVFSSMLFKISFYINALCLDSSRVVDDSEGDKKSSCGWVCEGVGELG